MNFLTPFGKNKIFNFFIKNYSQLPQCKEDSSNIPETNKIQLSKNSRKSQVNARIMNNFKTNKSLNYFV